METHVRVLLSNEDMDRAIAVAYRKANEETSIHSWIAFDGDCTSIKIECEDPDAMVAMLRRLADRMEGKAD